MKSFFGSFKSKVSTQKEELDISPTFSLLSSPRFSPSQSPRPQGLLLCAPRFLVQQDTKLLELAKEVLENKYAYACMCVQRDHAVMLKLINAIMIVLRLGKDQDRSVANQMAKRLFKDSASIPWLSEELANLAETLPETYEHIKWIAEELSEEIAKKMKFFAEIKLVSAPLPLPGLIDEREEGPFLEMKI